MTYESRQIWMIGPPKVGKTCITWRLIGEGFFEETSPTLQMKVDNFNNFSIIELGGQFIFSPQWKSLLLKGNPGLIFFVIDSENLEEGFASLKQFIKEVPDYFLNLSETVLLINKIDKISDSQENIEKLEQFRKKINITSIFCSAKTRRGFLDITDIIEEKMNKEKE
ncbi:MAG: ADP-ribosylation factor-like protein [Candidatus Hodarchaeota archaeon]